MLNKEQMALTMEILDRAEKLGIIQSDNVTAFIGLEKPTVHFNFLIEDMLKADDFNFAHDFVNIQNDINRRTGKFSGMFVPRFTGGKQDVQ